ITKIKCGFKGPRKCYVSPMEFSMDDAMINSKQKRLLTVSIYQSVEDEDEREALLSQIDEMTSSEANELLYELRK
ncbi:MAG: hypothetical protein WCF94_04320, partial [bacterium]